MNKKSKIMKLPSLLSFERKLETSDALMYAGSWCNDIKNDDVWQQIPITKRQIRSTQSSYGIDDAKKSEPNPVSSDTEDANLPHDKDTLKISFTLRIIGGLGKPFACNEPDFETIINQKSNAFKEGAGMAFETLAYRYAYNIVNGRFLWRNQVCAEKVKVYVNYKELVNPLVFNATDYSLKNFTKNEKNENLKQLTKKIQEALNNSEQSSLIEVDAFVKLGKGQHVFPSQEMNMGDKGKKLFQLEKCAAMHSVKIGNAIRTIDNWYDDAEFPIAVEPYGSVTQRGQAYRKSENDLYTLMESWVNEHEDTPENKKLTTSNKNYVVANFVRGGVFNGGPKNKK